MKVSYEDMQKSRNKWKKLAIQRGLIMREVADEIDEWFYHFVGHCSDEGKEQFTELLKRLREAEE